MPRGTQGTQVLRTLEGILLLVMPVAIPIYPTLSQHKLTTERDVRKTHMDIQAHLHLLQAVLLGVATA